MSFTEDITSEPEDPGASHTESEDSKDPGASHTDSEVLEDSGAPGMDQPMGHDQNEEPASQTDSEVLEDPGAKDMDQPMDHDQDEEPFEAIETYEIPEVKQLEENLFVPVLTAHMLRGAERPLAIVFSRYPRLSRCSTLGSNIVAGQLSPESALAYAVEQERMGWPDVVEPASSSNQPQALSKTPIGKALMKRALTVDD